IEHTTYADRETRAPVSAELVKPAAGQDDGFVHAETGAPLVAQRVTEADLVKRAAFNYLKSEPTIRVQSLAHKMSKSRGNVINPDDVVKAHGADVLRLYEMFMGPLEEVKPWQMSHIQGVVRFRDRLWSLGQRPAAETADEETRRLLHKTIKKVSADIGAMAFNTAIS